ncbi:MAG: P-loop NTPase, partial [Acidobacteria bacterium]|nr:P-loop NTPase [Acidobacteriota bacterium]
MNDKRRARRYAILSGKGGVGKSMIAANLGALFEAGGQRTLVVDADLGLANLDVILGLYPSHTLHDVLRGACAIEDAILGAPGGFDLLPAGSGLQEGTTLNGPMAESLESLLAELDKRYDALIFDAGAGIGDVVMFFARAAHEILLVVTPEATSLMDAYATIKVLVSRYGKRKFRLIVNQANPSDPDHSGRVVASHLQKVIRKFLTSDIGAPVTIQLAGCVPADPTVARAISHQRLLAQMDP